MTPWEDHCKKCGKVIVKESYKIYGNTGYCLSCNWANINYDINEKEVGKE